MRTTPHLGLAVVVLVLLSLTSDRASSNPGTDPSPPPAPTFTLVSQGGIALGSWQAGFAYFLTHWVREMRDASTAGLRSGQPASGHDRGFGTVTGASAGAVNGLIAALASCRRSMPAPGESLFFRVWVDSLGFFGRAGQPGLFPTDDTERNPLAILDERAMSEVAMKETDADLADTAAYVTGCAVDLGLTATHLDSARHEVHLQDGRPLLERASLRKKFALRLEPHPAPSTGPSPPAPSVAHNIPPPDDERAAFAGLGHEKVVDNWQLERLVQASGAFPVAFPPVDLAYEEYSLRTGVSKQTVGTFIDGGTFDNTPVGIALDLDRWRRPKREPSETRADEETDAEQRTYYFLEPNVTQWDFAHRAARAELARKPRRNGIISAYAGFAGAFISSSKDAEFVDTLGRHDFLRQSFTDVKCGSGAAPCRRLRIPIRQMPIAGEQLGAFLGFFERDFRVYDFYVGMADARRFLTGEERLLTGDPRTPVLHRIHSALTRVDPRYRLVTSYYDEFLDSHAHEPGPASPTPDRETPDRAQPNHPLTRRLPSTRHQAWRKPAPSAPGAIASGEGDALTDRNLRVLLAAMHDYRVWLERHPDAPESHRENAFFRALGGEPMQRAAALDQCDSTVEPTRARFRYRESIDVGHGNPYMSGCDVKGLVRTLAHAAAVHLSESQSGLSRQLFRVVHRPLLDGALGVKLWPKNSWGVAWGRGPELWWSRRLYLPLRLDLGFSALRLSSGFGPQDVDQGRLASSGFARLLVQDLVRPTAGVGLDLFAGGHFGFSPTDDWGRFGGPEGGLRVSFIDRLSVGYLHRYVLAQRHRLSRWHEGYAFVSFEFSPW